MFGYLDNERILRSQAIKKEPSRLSGLNLYSFGASRPFVSQLVCAEWSYFLGECRRVLIFVQLSTENDITGLRVAIVPTERAVEY